MIWSLELALGLFITTLWNHSFDKQLSVALNCICDDPNLCRPLHKDNNIQFEVFAFHLGNDESKHYDWSKITTIVIPLDMNLSTVCTAHANKAQIVLKADLSVNHLTNNRFRAIWIKFILKFIKQSYMDGIYLNVMEKIEKGSYLYDKVTETVREISSYFYKELPGFQISFHVPWSPHCKNEQCYDFLAISQACDILFVASYDIPNDLRDGCVARSSAPYHRVLSGMSDYIKLGIDSRKLVMGIAWYGYDYTCKRFFGVGECELEMASQGVQCSYTAAGRIPYKHIMQRLPRSLTGRFWDDDWKAPYFVYLDFDTYHEVWYDDPESISMRVSIVKKLNLRGIGVWTANDISYAGDARATMQAAEMWNALCPP